MRIACPSCAAEYEVPESLLAAGPRLLRCAQCGHRFEASRPAGAPPAAEPPAPPPPMREAPTPAAAPPPAVPSSPEPPEVRERPTPPPPGEPAPGAPRLSDPDRPPPTRGLTRHSPIDPPAAAPEAQEEEPSAAGRAAAWLLSLALIVAAGWATYAYHAEITEAWPPAARFYQALGLQ